MSKFKLIIGGGTRGKRHGRNSRLCRTKDLWRQDNLGDAGALPDVLYNRRTQNGARRNNQLGKITT